MRVLIFIVLLSSVVCAQRVVDCPFPSGCIVISQEAANKAAENARLIPALEAKISVLEQGLAEKDVSIAELKKTNDTNVQALTERLHVTEVELATKTGQLVGAEATNVRLSAIIDFMLKNGRTKKYGILVF